MKVLVLAPHPFYQERGSPIAVDLLVRMLSHRGDDVDILTYNEGEDRIYDRLRIHRIKPLINISNVGLGLSWKKIFCDIHLFCRFVSLMFRNQYNVVHAVEETSFMAMLVCPLRRVPFIYGMDSSMTMQIVDKYPGIRWLKRVLGYLESLLMRRAKIVAPMCDALADEARRRGAKDVCLLKDVSMILDSPGTDNLLQVRESFNISGKMVMYIGNLEPYQGIDLLLDSFSIVIASGYATCLVIIGGNDEDIEYYKNLAKMMDLEESVYFLGKTPIQYIGAYMKQADILVSPRTQGVNTPLKIYSYLDSGVAVLATALPTHTQVMNNEIAMLALPERESFANAMMTLIGDDNLRMELGSKAHAYIQRQHSYDSFREEVDNLYKKLER